ncbi:MAG TPA: universal stress protein [Acidobacteriaceae bacterium]|nr:universal stress protein [Acidobacteriaceae bacterium]
MSNKQLREWTHPRRILLATDLTDLGFTLPIAKQQALACKAELRIIHVLPDPSESPIDPVLMVYFDAAGMQMSAETTLGKVIADTKAEGIKCSFHLATGHTVKEILAAAAEWKADRIIAGSHGKAKFHHHILGSIAESLFHQIDIPVLAVGPKAVPSDVSPQGHMRIVFAAALDHSSSRIAEFALSVAEKHSADITLLHVLQNVVPEHPTTISARGYASRMLEDLMTIKPTRKARASCEVVYGQPAEAILSYAKQHAADMILLGASEHSAFNPRFIPGIAYRVLCEAHCPVLVLKEESPWQSAPRHSAANQSTQNPA